MRAGYLASLNRWRGRSARARLALAAAAIALLFAAPRALRHWAGTVAETLSALYGHRLVLAAVGAAVAALLVARRRAANRAAALRSWLAALPAPKGAIRFERAIVETAPASLIAVLSAVMFAVTGATIVGPSGNTVPQTAAAWLALCAGLAAGALIGSIAPLPKDIQLPPGSRYVPHRRIAGRKAPAGSLAALGVWPIRRVLASARPKAVARAVIPVLLAMPMGSSAATGLLVVGMAATVGALVLLVIAILSVGIASRRWLQPLPLPAGLLARHLLSRPLAAIAALALIAAWLLWVMGASIVVSAQSGLALLLIASPIAAGGCLTAIHRGAMSRR